MLARLLGRLVSLLSRILSRSRTLIVRLLYRLPLPVLIRFLSTFAASQPSRDDPRGRLPRGDIPSTNEHTIACSQLFDQSTPPNHSIRRKPSDLGLSIRIDPDTISRLADSPDEMSPPQIPEIRVNDTIGGSDIESRGRSPSVASSRTRYPVTTPQSPEHISIPQPTSPRPTSPRGPRHTRSPSHPTRTATLAHERGESLPSAATPTVSDFFPDFLRAPAPLDIDEPFNSCGSLGNKAIQPVCPEAFSRGGCRIVTEDADSGIALAPMTRSFEPAQKIKGWTPILHPDGVVYFFNKNKNIFTDAHIYNKTVYKCLRAYLATIEDFLRRTDHENLTGDCDLVLDLLPNNPDQWDKENGAYTGDYDCRYYFVDHKTKAVFWLDMFPANLFETNVKGVSCKTHLRHEIEAQYWYHCQLFPSSTNLSYSGIQGLRDIILHGLADTLVRSHNSTSPLGQEELNKALKWVNSLEKTISSPDGPSTGSVSLLSKLMFCFTRERFYHFYGQPAVRLARDLSVHREVDDHTLLIRILSPLLLSAPSHHLKTLRKIWVDQLMHVPAWKAASRKLTGQWRDFILYATVTLNANVAFLGIQSVDANTPPFRHPAQVSCYLSIVFSIGSIVTGLLLLKANRTEFNASYLYEKRHSLSAVETLAILHSLPYALLTWA
ncbi:hypothetical protein P691DRAFT_304969 [Macrolepiota fuliginosa MF-IS2]|uniref:WW domain-containing protein n=1 Tax=Macrolepiota fuliginosa MF-IS2 TaxID=1400762 RepID=A0A9P5X5G2_9AGAR|nr:hypothetical protein P691DRAFT_304969 [Macrolepiota fuliginosa MF-IS2]